jgi:hypothetical protein
MLQYSYQMSLHSIQKVRASACGPLSLVIRRPDVRHRMFKSNFIAITLSIFLLPLAAGKLHAEQEVTLTDGRTIALQDDGTWRYLSSDRYSSTKEGKVVRIRDDGTWEYTGEQSTLDADSPAQQQATASEDSQLRITKLEIESTQSTAHKSTRKQTQTVFHLAVTRHSSADGDTRLPLSQGSFSVEDTDGRQYPVVAVSPDVLQLQPGQQGTVVIRVDGSPHWWTTKAMLLELKAGTMDNPSPVVLESPLSEARKRRVDSF